MDKKVALIFFLSLWSAVASADYNDVARNEVFVAQVAPVRAAAPAKELSVLEARVNRGPRNNRDLNVDICKYTIDAKMSEKWIAIAFQVTVKKGFGDTFRNQDFIAHADRIKGKSTRTDFMGNKHTIIFDGTKLEKETTNSTEDMIVKTSYVTKDNFLSIEEYSLSFSKKSADGIYRETAYFKCGRPK